MIRFDVVDFISPSSAFKWNYNPNPFYSQWTSLPNKTNTQTNKQQTKQKTPRNYDFPCHIHLLIADNGGHDLMECYLLELMLMSH